METIWTKEEITNSIGNCIPTVLPIILQTAHNIFIISEYVWKIVKKSLPSTEKTTESFINGIQQFWTTENWCETKNGLMKNTDTISYWKSFLSTTLQRVYGWKYRENENENENEKNWISYKCLPKLIFFFF